MARQAYIWTGFSAAIVNETADRESALESLVLNDTTAAPGGGGGVWVKHSGTWKAATTYVKHAGTWKLATTFVKTGGVWEEV